MPRPFTRRQALENQAFLNLLRETGNVRASARALGQHRAKFTRRRAAHPAFAAEWDAALALADAALKFSSRRARNGKPPAERLGAAARPQRVRLGSGRLRRAAPIRAASRRARSRRSLPP